MLEVVFAEGAAGSLAIAMGKGEYIGGASSLVVLRDSEDAKQPDKEEELEILVLMEYKDQQVLLDLKALPELLVLQVLQVLQAQREPQVLAQPGRPALRA